MDLPDQISPLSPPEYAERLSFNSRNNSIEEEDESLLQNFNDKKCSTKTKRTKIKNLRSRCFSLDLKYWLAFNIILTTFNLAVLLFLALLRNARPVAHQTTQTLLPPSPAIEAIEKELRPFSLTSEYSNHPGPETDRLWEQIVNSGALFTLTEEEFLLVNDNPKTGIKFPHDPQGRYLGTLAATHQMHCVDSLRKAMWFHYEHYKNKGDSLFIDKDPPEEHLMHCVEMLRNAVMCSGDVSVITYNWKKGHDAPKASFKSLHACQKWDKIEGWRETHNVTAQITVLERPIGLFDDELDEDDGYAPGAYSTTQGESHHNDDDGGY
ncbi:hypothetical protein G7Y89_g2867 [Cudoniella acicularis]|uniref:Tat pathway signal sequence n=1 Tax=Cudoniella acicularis TaxID=354080 RepID=A0A8H4RTQ9_9HELO|nr:hypothetical protein G7Y89_g2867 [Cudoniella acicularis]